MNIYYNSGKCGDGKTYSALKAVASKTGKYIYAVDKIDSISERAFEFQREFGNHVLIKWVSHSGAVQKLEAIHEDPHPHQLVFVTHAALKLAQLLGEFSEWELIIDEDPSILHTEKMRVSASRELIQKMFKFKPTGKNGDGIVRVTLKTVEDHQVVIEKDTALSDDFKNVLRMCSRGEVYTGSMPKFEAGDKTSIIFWSVWQLDSLSNFKKVTILANAFESRLTYLIGKKEGINFIKVENESPRQWVSRPVTIRYFSANQRASDGFLNSETGHKALRKIAAWVNDQPQTGKHFWSKNKKLALKLHGTHIEPKATGRNDLTDYSTGTFIYAALPSSQEVAALSRLLDDRTVSITTIQTDREFETIAQMALRGSLRQNECTDPYEFRVFSKEQADFLCRFLTDQGYVSPSDVTCELVDLGIDTMTEAKKAKLSKGGRPRRYETPEEAAEARKAADRERKRKKKAQK